MTADRIIAAAAMAFATVYFYATSQITVLDFGDPIGPHLFPYFVGGLLITGAVMLLYETRQSRAPAPRREALPPDGPQDGKESRVLILIAAVAGWILLYILSFERLGYVISTTLFLLGLTCYFHARRWLLNVALSLLLPTASYLVFHRLLNVSLPRGLLPF